MAGIEEPPIDLSGSHYMEERALAIALEKAATAAQREAVGGLAGLRAELMARREAFGAFATAKRHESGEIYSPARVAAINAMMPPRAEMEKSVKTLYVRAETMGDVLKAHARTHFASSLVSQRLSLSHATPDIRDEARAMQEREEAFAAAWMKAIDDPAFDAEMRRLRQEAVALFRTSTRAMFLATRPEGADLDDEEAALLGKIWGKLDTLAGELGVRQPSAFVSLGDEPGFDGYAAGEIAPVIEALARAVAEPVRKFPSRKKAEALLDKVGGIVSESARAGGLAFFWIDT